jgi:hypothetical protein
MARTRKKKQPDKIDETMASLTPNLTKETFSEFVQKAIPAQREIDDAAKELSAAKGVLNGIFKQAEKAGIDKKDFKWALAQARMDHDERESSHTRRMTYMAFMDMPFGTQVSFDFAGAAGAGTEPENQPETMTELQQHRITDAGRSAGKSGMKADTNPWLPGTYAAQLWDQGWQEGQEASVMERLGSEEEDAIA